MAEKNITEKKASNMLAVVRVRGKINIDEGLKRSFELLNLHNKNWCVLLKDTPTTRGMLQKVKDYVTWGEVSEDLIKELFEKRGEEYLGQSEDSNSKIKYNKFVEYGGKRYKRYFRLSPPQKGYGRKGIKTPFSMGGALGKRGDKIEDLLKRMI